MKNSRISILVGIREIASSGNVNRADLDFLKAGRSRHFFNKVVCGGCLPACGPEVYVDSPFVGVEF